MACQPLGTYTAPLALSTGLDFFSGHPAISSVDLLPSVRFATPSYNGLCQHGFRSLLSTSEHGRPA